MKVQIISTIGPASGNEKIILEMIKNGMSVARLNFSWGSHSEHYAYIQMIRAVAGKLKKKVLIIQDLSGPRISKNGGHCFDGVNKYILTKKDLLDLDFAKEHEIDYVAQSFVGSAEDVLCLKREMAKRNFNIPIIAKIERQKSVDNLDEILDVSDAVMIARGDLGNEMPLEKIPYIQSSIIAKVKATGKPVITATEMMISMMKKPVPSRADVADVTRAILEGTDAVMLSEETAIGKYPQEVVAMVSKIATEAEKQMGRSSVNPL